MAEKDEYGFDKKYRYNREEDYPVKKTKFNVKSILFYISITIIIISILLSCSLAGYIAWNSVTNDPIIIKIIKTNLAILFSPLFLTYVFVKSIVFKLPN
uniref:Uncharacterized protein n=1 Tax=viral metagenome TaxID=1070528 RepID=A0A6C0IXY7_9ZZZZ